MKRSKTILKTALASVLLFIGMISQAQQIISITRNIDIPVDEEVLLSYISNLSNDLVWRAEVDSMVMVSSSKYGEGAIEYSSFGKNKTITPTFISKQTEKSIEFTTPNTAKYYLASIREVNTVEKGQARFKYTLVFDNNMTKEISPFRVPKFITRMMYGSRMNKYLKTLSNHLQNEID